MLPLSCSCIHIQKTWTQLSNKRMCTCGLFEIDNKNLKDYYLIFCICHCNIANRKRRAFAFA